MRLGPGEDLREALAALPRASGFEAGFVLSAVGSLDPAVLRFAGRAAATVVDGDLEIVALSGTLSPDGPHLHLVVADADGRVSGGHLLAGAKVRTTAEIVIGIATEWRFARRHDPRTGHRELHVTPVDEAAR